MGCGKKKLDPEADPADVPEAGDPAMDDNIDATGDEAKPPGAD